MKKKIFYTGFVKNIFRKIEIYVASNFFCCSSNIFGLLNGAVSEEWMNSFETAPFCSDNFLWGVGHVFEWSGASDCAFGGKQFSHMKLPACFKYDFISVIPLCSGNRILMKTTSPPLISLSHSMHLGTLPNTYLPPSFHLVYR